MPTLSGIHHITAMAGDAQRNVNFYAHALGQRLVKKTVNFDDPGTYHLYYGDAQGLPGSLVTFFPWPHARGGKRGTGEVAAFAYAAPAAAQTYWEERLEAFGARQAEPEQRFGETVLPFQDPDGLWFELALTATLPAAQNTTWNNPPVPPERALAGFHSATLWVTDATQTTTFFQNTLGWQEIGIERDRIRLTTGQTDRGNIIDVIQPAGASRGALGPGSIHHIAFRVADADAQLEWRARILQAGIAVTEVRDRQYFQSIYFRAPGGVLCEIATDSPGFAIDETPEYLGQALKLPPWLEPRRIQIEAQLSPLQSQQLPAPTQDEQL